MKRNGKKDFKIIKGNPQEKTIINKLTQSIDSDYNNYLKDNSEDKTILNNYFMKTKNNRSKFNTKNKEKESFLNILRSTIKI